MEDQLDILEYATSILGRPRIFNGQSGWVISYALGSGLFNYDVYPVYLSNYKRILEDYPFLVDVEGSLVLSEDSITNGEVTKEDIDSIYELIQSLENYPVYDEDALASVEQEQESEAWEYWAEHEFSKLLEEYFWRHTNHTVEYAGSSEQLLETFNHWRSEANVYWSNEGSHSMSNRIIDLTAIVRAIPVEELIKLPFSSDDFDMSRFHAILAQSTELAIDYLKTHPSSEEGEFELRLLRPQYMPIAVKKGEGGLATVYRIRRYPTYSLQVEEELDYHQVIQKSILAKKSECKDLLNEIKKQQQQQQQE